jgi:NAD+ kinase
MSARFSRIGLVGRFEDARVADSLAEFARDLLARRLTVLAEDCKEPGPLPSEVERVPSAQLAAAVDLIVAIGGDGTMLYAAQLAVGHSVPLLGINRGRLGFLTDVSPAEMTASFDAVLAGQYEADVRKLLAARLDRGDAPGMTCHALNDVVIQRYETGRMIELATWIGGKFVNSHGGDGLVIATPTGSTAYALSCGGPIMHPHLDAVVIAPISPHTLSDRPIVVGRDCEIEVRLARRATCPAQVTFDGSLLGDLEVDGRLIVGPSPQTITLLHPHGHDYFRILRSKLHWGRSAREVDPEA